MATFQQNNQEDKDKNAINQPQGSVAPVMGQPAMGSPAPNSPSNASAPARQGSGRFTNIQSYLNSNKGAGQQLAQGVAGQVQKKIDPEKKQAESYNEQVKSGIQSAQNTLNQGNQQLGQLQQIGQNIQSNTGGQFYGKQNDLGINQFTQDPNYGQFQQIQAGQGVNEDTLNLQQQAFQNQSNNFNKAAQDQSNLASTEGGRFNLLKQSFGGNVNPQYSQGQQRLDQMFLQKQGLGDLKQNLNQNVDASRGLQAQAQNTGKDVRLTTEQEQALMGNIGTTTKANESNYLKMLESYIPEVNTRREQEFTDFSNRLGGMASTPIQAGNMIDKQVVYKNGQMLPQKATPAAQTQARSGLTKDDLSMFGIDKNTQAFNVFDQIKADDISKRGRQASNFQDVSDQSNLDAYNALANMALTDQGSRQLTGVSNLDKALQAVQGQGSLKGRLDSAGQDFWDKAFRTGVGPKSGTGISSDNNYGSHNQYGNKAWNFIDNTNLGQILSGDRLLGVNRATGDPTAKADLAYKKALEDLRSQGFGNVLGTEGGITNAFDGLTTGVAGKQINAGGYGDSGGQKTVYSSDLDEQVKQRLANLGINDSRISSYAGQQATMDPGKLKYK